MTFTPEEVKDLNKDYPHKKIDITREVLTTKLKATQIKYRQAVDLGQKSSHGLVVFMFFDLCESIWGGSPTTEQLPSGLESTELFQCFDTPQSSSTKTASLGSSLNSSIDEDVVLRDSEQGDESSSQCGAEQRRNYLVQIK